MDIETQIAFEGTKEQQKLAARAFEAMKRKGMLFSASSPIKMTLEGLVKALAKDPEVGENDPDKLAPKIKAVLNKNEAIFARGNKDEYITTKAGRAPQTAQSDTSHTFKQRMNSEATALDADAAKEYAASLVTRTANRAEKSSLIETIIEIPVQPMTRPTYVVPPSNRSLDIQTIIPKHLIPQLPVMEQEEEEEEIELPAPRSQAAPVAETVTPQPDTQPRPTTRRTEEEAPAQPVTRTPAPALTPAPASSRVAQPESEVETPRVEPAAVQPVVEAATPTPVPTPAPVVAAKPKPAPTPAPAPVVTGPVEVNIPSPDGPITVDLNQAIDDILADDAVQKTLTALIEPAIASDTRLIRFGSDIFPEEAIERFSKGDYRRIKEYLDEPETGGVASDRDIMAEVLNRRTDHPDYERVRFSANYRMLKEKKDFEFVGIDTDRLWISANASPVPAPARKPAEIGQDYRFLEDPATASIEEEEDTTAVGPLDYSLTYYEYENGVLPYDQRFKRIFPGSIFEDQRASLLRFEIPQLYGALLGELRYPTGNRGGFIMGLSELFTAHMVPGAKFTIVPTDRGEDVFEIHFNRADEKEENLLQFDERRSRYVFRPVSYAVETDPLMLINQDRFGKLHNHKSLEEAERKRPDVIIANAFEIIGEQNDGKLWAAFEEIYPLVNIDRPISKSWLKTLLSGAYPFFYADEDTEGAYFYDQSKRPS